MANATTARPQKVTTACIVAGGASVVVLVSIVSALSSWGSVEVRDQIANALSSGPVDGVISVDQAMSLLRVVLMGIGAASAAAVVLAVFTAKRHRGAWIALSVLSLLTAVTFVLAGVAGILPALLGVMVVTLLWSKEARAWFSGQPIPAASNRTDTTDRSPEQGASDRSTPAAVEQTGERDTVAAPVRPPSDESDQPAPASRPYATPPGVLPPQQPAPYGSPQQPAPYGSPQQPAPYGAWNPPIPTPTGKPRALTVAVAVAVVMSALTALVFGLNVAVYLASPSSYADLIAEQPMITDSDLLKDLGMTAAQFATVMFALSLAITVVALAAIGSALWMLMRQQAARIVFTVVTGIAMLFSAAAVPFGLVLLVPEIWCLFLVWRRDVTAWLRAPR